MASLALIAALIFLSLLTIGPITYILSLFHWIPSIIKYLLGLLCSIVGLWATLIPVPLFRILGIVNLYIGVKTILETSKKTTKA